MRSALLSSLGCAVVSAVAVSAAQAQPSLFDQLDAATENTVAVTETADAPESSSSANPFSVSVLTYGAMATSRQRDARFTRSSTGLEEMGAEVTLGFSRDLGAKMRLKSEIVLEALNGRQPGQDTAFKARFGESYLHFDLGEKTWLRVGNLKLPHGTSDAFPILDLFNPRHDTLWGIDHPSGQTLPVPAAQLVSTYGDLRFQLVLGADFVGDRVAGAGQDHDYLIRDRSGTQIAEHAAPASYRPEWIASLAYFGEGVDLSIMAGEVYEKAPVLSGVGVGPGGLSLRSDHPRFSFAGMTAAAVAGSWLVRGDLGYFRDQTFFNQGFYANPIGAPGQFKSDVMRGVIGLEYSGFSNTILSLEVNRNLILDWEQGMRSDRISDSIAANAQIKLMDDRLALEASVASLSNGAATVLRAGLDFAVNDSNSLSVQWVDYQSNDAQGFMEPYRDADRLFVGWTTNF